jgi:hypothetical protein
LQQARKEYEKVDGVDEATLCSLREGGSIMCPQKTADIILQATGMRIVLTTRSVGIQTDADPLIDAVQFCCNTTTRSTQHLAITTPSLQSIEEANCCSIPRGLLGSPPTVQLVWSSILKQNLKRAIFTKEKIGLNLVQVTGLYGANNVFFLYSHLSTLNRFG